MDPKDQPQFNPKIPISEVLKQEQTGFVPSAPKTPLNDAVDMLRNRSNDTNNAVPSTPLPNSDTAQTNTNPTIPTPENTVAPEVKPLRIVKTFRSDAALATKTQNVSVAKIVIAEDKQRRERGEEIAETPKKKNQLLLMAIVLIALGAIAIPTVQYVLNRKKQEVAVVVEKTIIPFDHQEDVVLATTIREKLIGDLDILNAKQPVASSIEYRKIFEKIRDADKKIVNQKVAPDVFAGLIGPNMPPALARSFDSDYMYGIDDTKDPKPFVLFKTSSFQQTFANMLGWETKMITDLSPILNLGSEVLGRPFSDQVVINKNVRAATAPDGTIVFLYGFLDDQTLIITTNPQTFQDINSRYVAAHFVQ